VKRRLPAAGPAVPPGRNGGIAEPNRWQRMSSAAAAAARGTRPPIVFRPVQPDRPGGRIHISKQFFPARRPMAMLLRHRARLRWFCGCVAAHPSADACGSAIGRAILSQHRVNEGLESRSERPTSRAWATPNRRSVLSTIGCSR